MSDKPTFRVSVACCLLAVLGCSNDAEIVASCRIPRMPDGSSICNDVSRRNVAKAERFCRVASVAVNTTQWSPDKPCDTTRAIAGCQEEGSPDIMWVYPSRIQRDVKSVEERCQGKLVMPERDP